MWSVNGITCLLQIHLSLELRQLITKKLKTEAMY